MPTLAYPLGHPEKIAVPSTEYYIFVGQIVTVFLILKVPFAMSRLV